MKEVKYQVIESLCPIEVVELKKYSTTDLMVKFGSDKKLFSELIACLKDDEIIKKDKEEVIW